MYDEENDLILSGSIGNLIDRIIYGYVIDYLDFNIARGEIYINPIEERKVKRQFVYPNE